jgi:GrpB-like predicted nucleotidyltransferase (UPF0157 family)
MIGSVDPPAAVVDYDPAWPMLFEELCCRIRPALAGIEAYLEHVGSTAVPGLAGKPIIDMDVVVPTTRAVRPAIERLVAAGYTHQGDLGVAGREAFAAPPHAPYHHLYLVVEDSQAHRDHVDLRDYLRRRPEEARRYAATKWELAPLLVTDRAAYVSTKGVLVEELLKNARSVSTE